jgi:uncharacterized repeat protein (TIGR01451 family)
VIVVSKRAMRATLRTGQAARFVIRVRNVGGKEARNVTACDVLPGGLVFARVRGARFVKGDACWRIDRLRPGQTWRVTVLVKPVRVPRRVVLTNVARVTGPNGSSLTCAARANAPTRRGVCRAGARIAVLPAQGPGGGVTG